ncbi:MAG: UDP-3-O-(3-hydroxymyristoyl)glucosamine N-acyltransferase, partial [Muribaculaceae bacterium]|nr:UDP-3-O-(3-hydroxymyristoyl)glucosamine N-acyltransferase [Muribaculaceae bacterium]
MEITAQQLAQMVHGTIDGNANVTINNYAKIEEATAGCLTFLANPKYTHY